MDQSDGMCTPSDLKLALEQNDRLLWENHLRLCKKNRVLMSLFMERNKPYAAAVSRLRKKYHAPKKRGVNYLLLKRQLLACNADASRAIRSFLDAHGFEDPDVDLARLPGNVLSGVRALLKRHRPRAAAWRSRLQLAEANVEQKLWAIAEAKHDLGSEALPVEDSDSE